MDTIKLKFTRLQNEIFRILCRNAGKELNQREIAISLKVSPTAIAKSLKSISSDLVCIKRDKKMNLSLVQLNRDNPKVLDLKRCENLTEIYESNLINLLEKSYPASLIILFGSYSYGTDTIDSDIDLAVIGAKEKEIDLGKYEKVLNRKIIIQYYDSFDKIQRNLKNNLLNGIVLKGVIEI